MKNESEVTFTLRKRESERIYGEFMKGRRKENKNFCPFCNRDIMVKEFRNWIIVENRFPYDKVFITHHLLASKRHLRTYEELTNEEVSELKSIEYQVMNKQLGDYDVIIINIPARQSIPRHLHFHLATYKK